jgi:hypothetical protein
MKASYPWSEGLINLEESYFHVAKISSSGWHESSCPGVENLMKRRYHFFRSPKWRKVAQRKPCILQPRASRPLKNLIVRTSKGRTEALWMLDTFGSMGPLHLSNCILRSSKCYIVFIWKAWAQSLNSTGLAYSGHHKVQYGPTVVTLPWAEGLRTLEESHSQALKMPNNPSTKARYPWLEALMTLEE